MLASGQISDARIVVVEDQASDLLLLEQLLASAGFHNVGLTSDPVALVESFSPDQVDLVILDLWMPGLDGFSVLRQLREKSLPEVFLPVLVLTADNSLETRRRALVAGATDFLTKPFDVVEITVRVRHLLEVRRLQLALSTPQSVGPEVEARLADLESANRELSELVKAKDEFVAGVSHELRTALTGVLGFARELSENHDRITPQEVAGIAGMIAEAAGEAAAIVDDLLVAARDDIGSVPVRAETVDLGNEIEAAIRSLPRSVEMSISVPVSTSRAVGDRLRVRQVLRNLIGNAIRHGGPNIAVEIGTGVGVVEVAVVDDGPGVAPAEVAGLFDPYFRGSTSRGSGSTGIGLSVSRRLARLMGGDLVYVPGERGSRFVLTLPMEPM
jgi:signal transduction histidine kinase